MNNIVHGKCIDISSEGKGVVRIGKDTIFVSGLFINEEADILIEYHRAGVYYGKVKSLTKISPNRIEPKCKICTACGGCQYQQINYQEQLDYKTNRIKQALERIAHLKNIHVEPTLGMSYPYYYRNKIQVPFGLENGKKVVFGFYKENTHKIIPIKECVIDDKRSASILWDIKLLIEKYHLSIYNEDKNIGLIRNVLIRTSIHYNELMVVLVTSEMNFPGQRNFINELIKLHPEITTIIENVNSRHTNVILGDKEKVLYGKGYIKEDILGLSFNISASSFFQINPTQVEVLYSEAIKLLDPNKNEVVLDAYSGVGTIGLILSKSAKEVISVEINKSAHKNAIENAKRNNITNIKFYCDDASKFIDNYIGDIDTVIMDPPRSGSDEVFLSSLIKRKIKKIIYISCNPETLARDILYLSKYYDINYVRGVDMFPFTAHVETIVKLCLKCNCNYNKCNKTI